ncbi:YlzJ-like family protein [Aquibacillus rhizosphaerae]|uniref:YlzJ-like family protein n=1 Tax=Aquibacillus rhizosphaerae TaxID=3051431 RepID=A0ABT7KZU3_9BACI|nr:YlzJ-like family protein [Aquibacillus sp. LR5S19]MDL4839010.1 YlzJ-like family protein [Aquibacillus sp. LR5S19]
MILYTPLSQEDIYPTEQQHFENNQTVNVQGKLMQVENLNNGSCRIIQLLSTDPEDFLNQNFAPGSVISTNEIIN